MNAPKKIWVNEFAWKDYITSKNDVPYTRADIIDELWEDSITSEKNVPYIRADLVDGLIDACKTLTGLPETTDWQETLRKAVQEARAALKKLEETDGN